jgi:hypothetical protein
LKRITLEAYKATKDTTVLTSETKEAKLHKRKQHKGSTMSAVKITTAVRMLCEMRERLERKAAENGRSLSGEIVFRLRKSLEQEDEQIRQA